MTFYEAAVQILLREGKPLHASEITELAIKENLLSHVGKQPELTMASRLAAMARRSQDRRLVAVQPDIFGLTDWNLEESPEALEQSGLPEAHDEEEPALRTRERHPRIDKENVRVAGRGDRRRKYEELERKKKKKKKRLLPLPELVYEILDRMALPAPGFELAAAIREHDLVGEDLGREALENALRAENERREGEGRSPAFAFLEDGYVTLAGKGEEVPEGVDLAGKVSEVVARLAEERRPAPVPAAPAVAAAAEAPVAIAGLDTLVSDARQNTIRQLRRRLLELETSALESVASSMLDALGYRDVRVAKRNKDGSLFTCRRRMGLTEIRTAIRVIRGGRDVRREDVAELRRDMASHSAQMGVILSPSDATREARSEVTQPNQSLVTLLCADALADQLAERGMGAVGRTVTLLQFDERSFRTLLQREAAAEARPEPVAGRETTEDRRARRERERQEWRDRRQKAREERRAARAAAQAAAAAAGAEAQPAEIQPIAEGQPAQAQVEIEVELENLGLARPREGGPASGFAPDESLPSSDGVAIAEGAEASFGTGRRRGRRREEGEGESPASAEPTREPEPVAAAEDNGSMEER